MLHYSSLRYVDNTHIFLYIRQLLRVYPCQRSATRRLPVRFSEPHNHKTP